MAVFIAASDETSGGNHLSGFHYSGWVMPESDWSNFFVPAWQERILDGPPKIPYLHMTDMRSKAWREKWNLSQSDADMRLDEAAILIKQMGSMYPLNVSLNGAIFQDVLKAHKWTSESGAAKKYQPDSLAFNVYAFAVLCKVKAKNPEAEKVDFMVENNSEVTKHIYEFHKVMPNGLRHIGREDLIPLLGELLPVGKDRVPAQAADYLCWHSRRAREETLTDERDLRRFNTIAQRHGFSLPMKDELLRTLAESFTKEEKRLEEKNRI